MSLRKQGHGSGLVFGTSRIKLKVIEPLGKYSTADTLGNPQGLPCCEKSGNAERELQNKQETSQMHTGVSRRTTRQYRMVYCSVAIRVLYIIESEILVGSRRYRTVVVVVAFNVVI